MPPASPFFPTFSKPKEIDPCTVILVFVLYSWLAVSHVLLEVQTPLKTKHIQIAIFPLSPQVLNFLNPISARDSCLHLLHMNPSSNPFSFASPSPSHWNSIPSNLSVQSVSQILLIPRHYRDNHGWQPDHLTHTPFFSPPKHPHREHSSLAHLLLFRIYWWPIMSPTAISPSLVTYSFVLVFLFRSRNQSAIIYINIWSFAFLTQVIMPSVPYLPVCKIMHFSGSASPSSLLSTSSKITPSTTDSSDTPTGLSSTMQCVHTFKDFSTHVKSFV